MDIPNLTKQHLAVLALCTAFPEAPDTLLAHWAFADYGIPKHLFGDLRHQAAIALKRTITTPETI